MSFSEQVKRRREELGLTRPELAERLAVTASAVSNYETENSFPKGEVLLRLFDALETDPNTLFRGSFRERVQSFSPAEQELIEKCRSLSPIGRQTVHAVAEALCSYRDDLAESLGRAEEQEPRIIPLYRYPAAAGYASPVCGEDFDYITADENVPMGAEFGVRIQGDSMAPHIADGSVVYVNRDPLANGDVGIFCVDGDVLCKQYYRDSLGITYLFSLNRARADADVVFPADSGRFLACFGRVMTARRFALPGM